MKKFICIGCMLPSIGFGQNVDDRVRLIRSMYSKSMQLSESSKKSCKTISDTEPSEASNVDSQPIRTEIKHCTLGEGYSTITYTFVGDHYYENARYFFRYNSLYFYFGMNQSSSDDAQELRQYFNEEGLVIRTLINDGSGNKEIKKGSDLSLLYKSQKILIKDEQQDSTSEVKQSMEEKKVSYDIYYNDRYGFRVKYPVSHLQSIYEAESKDGVTISSEDTTVELVIFRDFEDLLGNTLQDTYKEALKDYKSKKDIHVTYKKQVPKFFVLSGYEGDFIFYQKTIQIDEAFFTGIIKYPISQKEFYNPIVTEIFTTEIFDK